MPAPKIDELDKPIWGVLAIGEIIGRSKFQTHHMLRKGRLDADLIGRRWTTTPRRLLRQFNGEKKMVPAEGHITAE
jgi:hypothetical protein